MKEEDRARRELLRDREEETAVMSEKTGSQEITVKEETDATAEDVRREAAETSASADRASVRAASAETAEDQIHAVMTERA